MAARFVAGETLEEAIGIASLLSSRGMRVALAYLGEHVTDAAQAREAAAVYEQASQEIQRLNLPAYLSPKLTQLGLDISEGGCRENLRAILNAAAQNSVFVRVDMEGSAYTETTLRIVEDLHREFPNVGTVLQSYLHRSPADLERLLEQSISVRIVKGAYSEPDEVAYQSQKDVERSYKALVERALSSGARVAVATHNDDLLAHARAFATQREVPIDNYEFQMLYGIRRTEQERLVAAGFNVRVYVPFGPEWYPYFMRRLGERPANAMFLLRNLFR
ncbi:MAG TPA: proline dehydrogenase family protein [Dehalococcoidia bacterium]|nr:proline dehydrogenase family protein [Dehalococcoidia bacterium]